MNPAQAMKILDGLAVREHQAIELWDDHGTKYTWVIWLGPKESYVLWSFGPTGYMSHGLWEKRRLADAMINKFEGVTGA